MSKENRYEILLGKVKEEFPRFTVKKRDSSWLFPIFWLLTKITGQDYTRFSTTIFSTMYVGPIWDSLSDRSKYQALRHELVHVRQFHRFPLGRWLWPINHLLMALCYTLLFPVLWTMRAEFEREGYTQTLLVDYEIDGTLSDSQMENRARWLAGLFGSGSYGWMWTRAKAYAWAMETMRRINSGHITNPWDRVELSAQEAA